MPRPRAVLFRPYFFHINGGALLSAWLAQTIAETHDLTVLCDRPPDLEHIDACYGTSLASAPVTFTRFAPARGIGPMLNAIPGGGMLSVASLQRDLIRWHFELRPTLWAASFPLHKMPANGFRYLHHPDSLPRYPSDTPAHWPRWRRSLFNTWQTRLADCGRGQLAAPADDLLAANSAWTAAGLAARGVPDARVLYPPVPPMAAGLPWDRRENRVVLLGRWAESKRMELAVAIVDQARLAGAGDLRLSFAGSWTDMSKARVAQVRARLSRDWVDWHERPSRAEVETLVGRCRYGIHCMHDEHFGIAIAELLTAGCVTLVHDSGGAREIQDNAALRYRDAEEGAAILARLVRSPDEQLRLQAAARPRGLDFSPARFTEAVRPLLRAATRPWMPPGPGLPVRP